MDGAGHSHPGVLGWTERIFLDFQGRRDGLVKALTEDVEIFYQRCDPEKENLGLYGYPNGRWDVCLPPEEVPDDFPEPPFGINFARDGMPQKDWLTLVAMHSDSWLLALAFYSGGRFGLDKDDRKRLFSMMNDLPTLVEVVTGVDKKQPEEKPADSHHSSDDLESNSEGTHSEAPEEDDGTTDEDNIVPGEYEFEGKTDLDDFVPMEDEDKGTTDDNDFVPGQTLSGKCCENESHEIWIGCDICRRWFHRKCVTVTPAKADRIKGYKCPFRSNRSCSR